MQLILLGPILLLLLVSTVPRVLAQNSDDFMNEEDAVDDHPSVPIGGSGGTEDRDTQSEGATSFDFNNGDKGCDTNHQHCKQVAHHGSTSNNETSMTKLINSLSDKCMVVKEPTSVERVAGIRTTVEITCEG